tara:strand:+ start:44 stop:448 length:405 start_codon:yes stop_codon:yes gene_type:complete
MLNKLLFLCTGNSCRSQIAEGFAKIKLNKKYQIYSAGIEAHGLNPNAISVMREVGIDISTQKSKKVSNHELSQYDFIITLCGDARDRCPVLINNQKNIHWDLEDPANAKGSNYKVMNIYRIVRDQISRNIDMLL